VIKGLKVGPTFSVEKVDRAKEEREGVGGRGIEIEHNTLLDTKSYLGTPYFMNTSE